MKRPASPRRHLTELDALRFAPGEKAPHGAGIGAAGVGIGDLGREELVSGKAGGLSGSLQDGGEGLRPGAGAGNQHVHIHIIRKVPTTKAGIDMLPTGSMRNPNLTALLIITHPVSESVFDSAHCLAHVRLRP